MEWLSLIAAAHPGSRLVIGASLAADPDVARLDVAQVDVAGIAELRTSLPLLRELVATGRLVHDGGEALTEQIERARVVTGTAGLALPRAAYRSDLLRAASGPVLLRSSPRRRPWSSATPAVW